MTDHTRRGLLTGLGATLLCAPAIVRASSLDAIRGVPMGPNGFTLHGFDMWGNKMVQWLPYLPLWGDPIAAQWTVISSITVAGGSQR